MKKMTLKGKIILWFSSVLVVIIALTYVTVIAASNATMQKTVRDNLVETVEDNVDEVELFSPDTEVPDFDYDDDVYIPYHGGTLEIDDDFIKVVNGVYTSVYSKNSGLLHGENPIAQFTDTLAVKGGEIRKVKVNKTVWYVYDRTLEENDLPDLYLRAVVSSDEGTRQISSVIKTSMILMPILLVFAVLGGYIIAVKSLRPIKDITDTARNISQGHDLKKRIEASDGSGEIQTLTVEFNRMFDRLDKSFELQQRFASDASHELRTPTAVIMAQCEYSLDRDRTPAEYKDAIRTIRRQGAKLSKMIDDMLIFTRMEAGSQKYAKTETDLSSCIKNVCDDMSVIPEKNIMLSEEIEPCITVLGNASLLSRLATNLISNAYRYGKEDGHIWINLKKENGDAMLSVKDDGIGIKQEDTERIFERFFQADSSRNGAGSGLGLSMVKEIALFHGGNITVESKENTGSEFIFKMKAK